VAHPEACHSQKDYGINGRNGLTGKKLIKDNGVDSESSSPNNSYF
jgi:hypothetical protein